MIAALSPYLLTTREPAAMVTMLLADHVVTVVPSPDGVATRESVGLAAGSIPSYLELLESWSWSMPLWEAGVIASDFEGDDAIEDIRAALIQIETDDRFAAMRPLMHAALEDTGEVYLRRFADDLLKAGPDPAISVPVAAGLDRYAGRLGLNVVRGEPASVAAKQETGLMRTIARFAMPALMQAGGQRLLVAREELRDELDALRDCIDNGDEDEMRSASGELSEATERIADDLTRVTDPEEPRTILGTASVMLAELPAEAVQRSSCLAAGRMLGRQTAFEASSEGALVRTLVVRRIGSRSGR
ncbi:MAG: hypothetical protein AAFR76_00910 [Planctomycetota bacterium]